MKSEVSNEIFMLMHFETTFGITSIDSRQKHSGMTRLQFVIPADFLAGIQNAPLHRF